MTVIDLGRAREERQPHMSGEAACLVCKHKWAAVAPVGTHEFECPQCGSFKGYMVNPVVRGSEVFECFCGCDVFRISPELGPYCVNCATPAEGWF